MPGPWPITLITWNQLAEDAEAPIFESDDVRFFKGPGGKKGPSCLALLRATDNALELAKAATANPDAWTIEVIGTYNLLDESLTEPPLGAEQKGLMIGLTDCRSAQDQEAFSTWYRDVHAADVLKAGFHQRAYRYQSSEESDGPAFCALYETTMGGFEAFKALMLHYRENPSPVEDFCVVRHVWALEAA